MKHLFFHDPYHPAVPLVIGKSAGLRFQVDDLPEIKFKTRKRTISSVFFIS